ncbi:MAG: cytochrome c oxidase assembly protein [Methylococcaceae bacterium]|nr:cytochrome c oxidase assembly protein [Methylococcaceae bacterium]
MDKHELEKANARLVWRIVVIVALMFGFGFAVAPYYDSICAYWGIGGRPKGPSPNIGYSVDESREITLEFVTAVNGAMPLAFRAEKAKLKIHPGQYYSVKFYAENQSDKKLVGRAIPTILPISESSHLKKVECFCFSEQVFEPHQEREMPVRFVVDPEVQADVKDMTLSYTFFDITEQTQTNQ